MLNILENATYYKKAKQFSAEMFVGKCCWKISISAGKVLNWRHTTHTNLFLNKTTPVCAQRRKEKTRCVLGGKK